MDDSNQEWFEYEDDLIYSRDSKCCSKYTICFLHGANLTIKFATICYVEHFQNNKKSDRSCGD